MKSKNFAFRPHRGGFSLRGRGGNIGPRPPPAPPQLPPEPAGANPFESAIYGQPQLSALTQFPQMPSGDNPSSNPF